LKTIKILEIEIDSSGNGEIDTRCTGGQNEPSVSLNKEVHASAGGKVQTQTALKHEVGKGARKRDSKNGKGNGLVEDTKAPSKVRTNPGSSAKFNLGR
jgi:hypothetical protein